MFKCVSYRQVPYIGLRGPSFDSIQEGIPNKTFNLSRLLVEDPYVAQKGRSSGFTWCQEAMIQDAPKKKRTKNFTQDLKQSMLIKKGSRVWKSMVPLYVVLVINGNLWLIQVITTYLI